MGLGVLLAIVIACTPRESTTTEQAERPKPEAGPEPAREPSVRVGLEAARVPEAIARPVLDELGLRDVAELIAVRHRIDPHWHIYWRNPGETGLPTRLSVKTEGVEPGEVLFPAPERFVAEGGQVSFGWDNEVVLFVPLKSPASALTIESRWLACKESCVPGRSEATLAAGEAADDPSLRAMLDRLPRPIGERLLEPTWQREGSTLTLTAKLAGASASAPIDFFPYATDPALFFLDHTLQPDTQQIRLRWRTGGVELPAPVQGSGGPSGPQGVLAWTEGDRTRYFELALPWPAP